jgi:chloramphenicol 3-O-phosphotransferase
MITVVLGAPGSGKSTVTPLLRALMPGCIVMDWDVFMEPAALLAGRDIRSHPETWPGYRELVRTALETMAGQRVVLLGVAAPDDLEGWPISSWLVLDCTDQEQRRRLTQAGRAADASEAVADAADYRSLGLPAIDTTALTPGEVASELARHLTQM